MPIYEYICTLCQYQTEQLQKFTDPPLEVCPQCGGPMYRPISRTSFHLKGGGWYKDGYGSAKPEKPEGKSAETAAPAPTTAGEPAKTDTAAKSEPAGTTSDSSPAKTGGTTATPASTPSTTTSTKS